MSAADWGTIIVKTIILAVVLMIYARFAVWLGRALKAASERLHQAVLLRAHMQAIEEDREWERARALERQRRLLRAADEIMEAPTTERLRLMREAESLGFLDMDGAA